MPTYAALNPRHTRVVEIDNLWWMADAWNDRTTEWFSSDPKKFRRLLEGIFAISHLNVPEFMPSAEWVANVCQSVFRLELKDKPHRVGLFQTAYALEEYQGTSGDNSWRYTNVTLGAANLLSSMIPLTDDNLPRESIVVTDKVHGDYYVGLANKSPAILRGLAANPTLPALTTSLVEGTDLTPYRWLVQQAIRTYANGNKDSGVLDSLSMNLGASTEDLDFFLDLVDREVSRRADEVERRKRNRANGDASWHRSKMSTELNSERIYERISMHPNFISWPSIEKFEEEQTGYVKSLQSSKSSAVTCERTNLDADYSANRRNTALLRPQNYATWVVEQSLCESLLTDSKNGLTRKLKNRIKVANGDTGDALLESEEAMEVRAYLGFYAPVLGAVFSSLDAKYGTSEIPLEWLVEML